MQEALTCAGVNDALHNTNLLWKVEDFLNIESSRGIGTLEETRRNGGDNLLQPLAFGVERKCV